MTTIQTKFDTYDQQLPEEKTVKIDGDFNSLSFVYDGGRLDIYVGEVLVYKNYCAGNDFSLSIIAK